jgi:fatty acid desaturase/ABC-type phosphate/phosphonate transport system substrate-binding protein
LKVNQVLQNSDASIQHFIRSIDADRQTWFERHDGPTLLVAFAIYAGWMALLSLHHRLPSWLLAIAGGYVVQWHSSLQHEAIHGMRGLPGWLRTALVYPPIGGWLPFDLYRRSHVQHHRNSHLTDPQHDTESYYHEGKDWEDYSQICRRLLIVNQTFLGRLFIGPFVHTAQLCWTEGRRIILGDTANAGIWLRHLAAFALILLAVTAICDMPLWLYIAAFSYPGLVFGMMRGYTEHRWGERADERTAVVESNWVFGLLFLWNNLHAVHHSFPAAPWYKLPRIWREHRDHIIACNGGFVFKGYGEIARRWLIRPNFIPVHPGGAANTIIPHDDGGKLQTGSTGEECGAWSSRRPRPKCHAARPGMRSASLPMYPFAETAPATAAFWDALCMRLVAGGLDISDVMFEAPLAAVPEEIGPDVLFTQFCGYPLFKSFRDQGLVLATPHFAFAGCEGPNHRAFFMVRAKDPAECLDDLRGRVFGCNGITSNSGMNLPRHTISRIAGGRPFFGKVVITGGHLASLEHLYKETIDLCAIDCVTWGLFRKFRPTDAIRYRILTQTAPSPSLPYVTSTATDARAVAMLRESLDTLFLDPATAGIRDTLGLTAVSVLNASAYERLADYEKEAADLGYPGLQ